MRKLKFITNYIYHIYNRGVDKRKVFLDQSYFSHFIEILRHSFHFDLPYSIFIQQLERARSPKEKQQVLEYRETRRIPPAVETISFCLMPNHIHLTLKQLGDQGITKIMHRVTTAFTKYFNLRQNRTGRLFEGSFKARLVESEEQLFHLNRYHHINPRSLGKEYLDLRNLINYPWSSLSAYLDYFDKKSKRKLAHHFSFVNPEPVLTSFNNRQAYLDFIQAKIDQFEPLRLELVAVDDDFGWFAKFRAMEESRRQKLITAYTEASVKA